jgi:hypothetical protein
MDIHKPKAAHSWREFAVEIGTIVIGVLIALGAEQAVEWSRWRHELGETRVALALELASDTGSLRASRAQDACIDARLDLFSAWAAGRARINSANLASVANRPLLRTLYTSAWDVAKTGEVASHMPVAERNRYAVIYDSIGNQQYLVVRERDAWLQLARYAGKAALNDAESRRLLEDVATARAMAATRRLNTPVLENLVLELGVRPRFVALPKGSTATDLCAAPT